MFLVSSQSVGTNRAGNNTVSWVDGDIRARLIDDQGDRFPVRRREISDSCRGRRQARAFEDISPQLLVIFLPARGGADGGGQVDDRVPVALVFRPQVEVDDFGELIRPTVST